MKINKELLKGSTATLVLGLLDKEPMYGYQLIKEISLKSNGVFELKEGTLYPILHDLEKINIIESYWNESSEGRKRKYYKITKEGKNLLEHKKEEWSTFKTAVDKFVLGS
ncbi:MAG: PadR family transcriptional regulator [Bacillota bacterium]|nr:PadR family transcriptional regulator [Bacillota bacterium]